MDSLWNPEWFFYDITENALLEPLFLVILQYQCTKGILRLANIYKSFVVSS